MPWLFFAFSSKKIGREGSDLNTITKKERKSKKTFDHSLIQNKGNHCACRRADLHSHGDEGQLHLGGLATVLARYLSYNA